MNESNNTQLKRLSAIRLAFFIASILLMIGIVGTLLGYKYFLALPAVVAGGLLLASVLGWCPMVFIIEKISKRVTYQSR